jgi:hypothetical protein
VGKYKLLFSLVVLLSMAAMSFATTTVTWDRGAGSDDWNTGVNWSTDTVPPNSSSYYVAISMSSGPVIVSPQAIGAYRITLSTAGNGTLTNSGGALTVGNHIFLAPASGDIGTLNMNGGTIDITGTFYIGRDSGSTGTLNLSAGTITCGTLSMGSNGGT